MLVGGGPAEGVDVGVPRFGERARRAPTTPAATSTATIAIVIARDFIMKITWTPSLPTA